MGCFERIAATVSESFFNPKPPENHETPIPKPFFATITERAGTWQAGTGN